MSRRSWRLAIDYGTSYTTAAIDDGERVEVLEIDDARRLPSGVLLLDDGTLLCGRAATGQARGAPDRFERTPKRLVGQDAALLGGRPVPVVDMVAAVLRRVAEAAQVRQGGTPPSATRLTHPAVWGPGRLDVLREAARRAGLGAVELLSEPEAAAWYFVPDRRGEEPQIESGQSVAIYDLGGGTFDTAVLRRDEYGFALAGPPGGDEWFGGEDLDERLLEFVLQRVEAQQPALAGQLQVPGSSSARRARLQLADDVRAVKEALSSVSRASVPVAAGPDVLDVEVTRDELERLVQDDLRRTVDIVQATLAAAGLTRSDLAAIYLTGGSSRIPLVAAMVSGLHPQTFTRPDPKTLVAEGALVRPHGEPRGPEGTTRIVHSNRAAREAGSGVRLVRRSPRVEGRPVVGGTLRLDPGEWAAETEGVELQWLRRAREAGARWVPIEGAIRRSHRLTEGERGQLIAVRATGRAGGQVDVAQSRAVGPVEDAAVAPERTGATTGSRRSKPRLPVLAAAAATVGAFLLIAVLLTGRGGGEGSKDPTRADRTSADGLVSAGRFDQDALDALARRVPGVAACREADLSAELGDQPAGTEAALDCEPAAGRTVYYVDFDEDSAREGAFDALASYGSLTETSESWDTVPCPPDAEVCGTLGGAGMVAWAASGSVLGIAYDDAGVQEAFALRGESTLDDE